jgi:hypothetical protein
MFDRAALETLARLIAEQLREFLPAPSPAAPIVVRVVVEAERRTVVYTRQQVAEMCHTSTSTVDRWRKIGLRSSSPSGGDVLIRPGDLDDFLFGE